MLISKERAIYKEIDKTKTFTGSFYTKKDVWLLKPVSEFLSDALSKNNKVLDPYVGDGDLLTACRNKFKSDVEGYDIKKTNWQQNDSLLKIPNANNCVIVTNPPYLAKYSAKRKRVFAEVGKYFDEGREDLYQVALDRCLESSKYVVAIIPETFLNSSYSKEFLELVCVLEENPFEDTENPVCVACFNTEKKSDAKLYINEKFCGTFSEIFSMRKISVKKNGISFNVPNGRIALKAVDGTSINDFIRFTNANAFEYSRDNIKHSSRLLTYLEIDSIDDSEVDDLVKVCNKELKILRDKTSDIILSPFKGNNKNGKRRRRLDYTLARVIIEKGLLTIKKKKNQQKELFS